MMSLKVTVDASKALTMLKKLEKQVKFAEARAMTAVAKRAVNDLKTEMSTVFQNPSAFTLNAFYARPATSSDPSAYVNSRDFATKGRPAIRYLWPEIAGGPRQMKGFENLLSGQSGDQFAVPPASRTLSRGQITQVLSRLNAMRDATANASDTTTRRLRKKGRTVAASGHRTEYFVAHEAGAADGRPIGIYKLIGPGNVQRVMGFVPSAPKYIPRFAPTTIVRQSVGKYMPEEFRKALATALATMK
jgi:hypothetical protein